MQDGIAQAEWRSSLSPAWPGVNTLLAVRHLCPAHLTFGVSRVSRPLCLPLLLYRLDTAQEQHSVERIVDPYLAGKIVR